MILSRFWCFVSIFTSINMQIGTNVSFQKSDNSIPAHKHHSAYILCVSDVYETNTYLK